MNTERFEFREIALAIEIYFNSKLARAFNNYKLHKGFTAMILTNLYLYLNVAELLHFELPMNPNPFYMQTHTSQ